MVDFSPEALRARFHELSANKAPLDAERDALWADLNALVAGDTDLSIKAARAREEVIRARVKELHALIGPIELERACCARALNGKTGELQDG